jgi:hypothetical protein
MSQRLRFGIEYLTTISPNSKELIYKILDDDIGFIPLFIRDERQELFSENYISPVTISFKETPSCVFYLTDVEEIISKLVKYGTDEETLNSISWFKSLKHIIDYISFKKDIRESIDYHSIRFIGFIE